MINLFARSRKSAKVAAARRQGRKGYASCFGGALDTAAVLRVVLITLPLLACLLSFAAPPQDSVHNGDFEGNPAVVLSNDKLALTITTQGSTLAGIVLKDDPEKLSPLWNPLRMARELGHTPRFDGGAGLFVCVDGFGPVSPEERAAGLPGHGEAHTKTFTVSSERQGSETALTLHTTLPLVQENFTRTFRLADGENVVSVESELESLLAFDHPVNWAEHATIGSPFLESGVTVVDISGERSQTRPYTPDIPQSDRRLDPGKDFTWPNAPGLNGQTIDLRETPSDPHYIDHATTLLDPHRDLEWATAINPKMHKLIGYLFRRDEYPWLQYWGRYPENGKFARGMEFSTQPYDVPRREVIGLGSMFGVPVYRWLPAKSKITSKFLVFYTTVPQGLDKVSDVRLENGKIVIVDRAAGLQVVLPTIAKL